MLSPAFRSDDLMLGKMDIYGLTDIGPTRKENQDQFLIADLNKSMRLHRTSLNLDQSETLFGGSQGQLMLVADGMGGAAAGEIASRMAVDTITTYILNTMPWFYRLDGSEDEDFEHEMHTALAQCQSRLRQDMATHPSHDGMGTTLTLGYLIWPKLYIVHAGDSRCYLLRNGELRQVTRDHTVAQELVDRGTMTEDDAAHSSWRHVLSNVLGGSRDQLHPEVYRVTLELGDSLLFCTDGLSGVVPESELLEALSRKRTAEEVCIDLINRAVRNGTRDNVTAIVSQFLDQIEEPTYLTEAAAIDEDELDPDEQETLILKSVPVPARPATKPND